MCVIEKTKKQFVNYGFVPKVDCQRYRHEGLFDKYGLFPPISKINRFSKIINGFCVKLDILDGQYLVGVEGRSILTDGCNADELMDYLTSLGYPTKHEQRQFVYIFSAGKYSKIGVSKNPTHRLGNINTSCPLKVELHRLYWVDDARRWEGHLHQAFAHQRIKGEWFNLDIDDISSIDKCMKSFIDFSTLELSDSQWMKMQNMAIQLRENQTV